MEKNIARTALSALAHDMRLDVFRLLVAAGHDGLCAGDISAELHIRANTLSNNLTILANAGLIRSEREGRSIRYFAQMQQMDALLSFLVQDCCGGRPELCAPSLEHLASEA